MVATLACANCGAEGESNFSTNYFGELVCELCGTQSYLQSRTETQDAEDMGLDIAALSRMKRRTKRKKRERRIKAEPELKKPVQVFDCIVATQYILNEQAEALVAVGFPPEMPRVVREVWFHFLHVWHSKGARPILRCFTEFHYQRHAEDKAMDPAVTNDVLEQWDAENGSNIGQLFTPSQPTVAQTEQDAGPTSVPHETERMLPRELQHTLDWFVLPDLIGMLVLAGRILNVAALPCDYMYWIDRGDLPYYNLLSLCPMEIQEAVERVAVFFDATIRTNWVSPAAIAYRAHYLQFHLEMRVPPLNAALIAYNMCENLNLPPQVFRNFQWLTGHFNIAGDLVETPIDPKPRINEDKRGSALDSGAGIAGFLLAAIRLCPNWTEWIYERKLQREHHVPPYSAAEADRMPRRELKAYAGFCEDALLGTDRGRIPNEFVAHVDELKTRFSENNSRYFSSTYEDNPLRSYPSLYEDGVSVEPTKDMQERVEQMKVRQRVASGNTDRKLDLDLDEAERRVPPTLFYPVYSLRDRTIFHAPFEGALELLAEYMDCPMGVVMKWTDRIDSVIRERANAVAKERGQELHEERLRLGREVRAEKERRRLEKRLKAMEEGRDAEDIAEDDDVDGDEYVGPPIEFAKEYDVTQRGAGPGRVQSIEVREQEEEDDEEKKQALIPEPPVRRKRGRPRKNPILAK